MVYNVTIKRVRYGNQRDGTTSYLRWVSQKVSAKKLFWPLILVQVVVLNWFKFVLWHQATLDTVCLFVFILCCCFFLLFFSFFFFFKNLFIYFFVWFLLLFLFCYADQYTHFHYPSLQRCYQQVQQE